MSAFSARRLLAASAFLIAACAGASEPAPEAESLAQRMLAAIGGRTAWANTRNTVNDSRQDWDGEKHWRLSREGKIESLSAETLAMDRRFYAGHVYRTLHRIAARDPALKLSVGRQGRLEVHEAGARIAWYELDRAGSPTSTAPRTTRAVPSSARGSTSTRASGTPCG